MAERKIYIMRHGERCDFLLGNRQQGFMKSAFDANGKYNPFDINLPRVLPKRNDGWQAYACDTPLTEIGYLEAKLTGRAYRDRNIEIDHIYCSPALRCVQTAVGFLKGMASDQTFRVEPGLFEWMYWLPNGRASWMQPTEFKKLGYPVNLDHQSIIKESDLRADESLEDYYRRSYFVIHNLIQRHPTGNILIMAHGASLDVCTRQLLGKEPRSVDDFFFILRQTSYLANVELTNSLGRWMHTGRPVPPLTISANSTYNPLLLQMNDEQLREELKRRELDRKRTEGMR